MDQLYMAANNPVCGQLNKKTYFFSPRSRLRIWSRETGVWPSRPASARSFSIIFRLTLVLTRGILPALSATASTYYAVKRHRASPELIGQATAYRWRLLPRVPAGTGLLYGHHINQSMDQPGKVANPARGQLNKEK